MYLSLIAAMDNARVIGSGNELPWHLPADLKRFKSITLGKPVVMGRKTFESIGKPLLGRRNVVLSRKADLEIDGVDCVANEDALNTLLAEEDEVMIIGGGEIYQRFLPVARKLYLTLVDAQVDGDVVFPDIDFKHWREVEREAHGVDEKHAYPFCFVNYERV